MFCAAPGPIASCLLQGAPSSLVAIARVHLCGGLSTPSMAAIAKNVHQPAPPTARSSRSFLTASAPACISQANGHDIPARSKVG